MKRRAVISAIFASLFVVALATPAIAATPSKPAVVRFGSHLQWLLRNSVSGGPADITFVYGSPTIDFPVFGDWNGDGTKTPGVSRAKQFLLRNSNTGGNAELTISYGGVDDFPIVGDWDGDGTDTIGVVRPRADGRLSWLLRNSNTSGVADVTVVYGSAQADDFPVVGDFDGDGTDTIGVVRPRADDRLSFLLRNSNTSGVADVSAVYGSAVTDIPVIGDWDGDATDTVGVVRNRQWLLRNSNTGGSAQVSFAYGSGADNELPLVWQ